MSTFRQKVQATTNWVKPNPEDIEEAPHRGRRAAAARARKRPGAPVTAHRLFPAFAALWFAALFGLGSLAIPSSLLGALVLKTGLPALVPAARPPLGFTAHLLVALMLAGFGAALGLALALRLNPRGVTDVSADDVIVPAAAPEADDAYKVRARDAHPDAPPRRPLVLTEAFADPIVEDAEPAASLLRRKPALLASEPASEPFSEPANEPASEPSSEAGPWIPEFAPGGVVRPLDLSALDLIDPIGAPAHEPVLAEPEMDAAEPMPAPAEAEPDAEHAPEIALQPSAQPAAPALIAATPQLPAGFAAALPDVTDGTWSPVADAPLEGLGLVQLIERLALAIAAHKASNAVVIDADAEAQAEPGVPDVEAAPAEEPEEREPAFEPGPFSRPTLAGVSSETAEMAEVGSAREAILRRLGALAAGDMTGAADSATTTQPAFSRPAPVSASGPTEAVVPLRPAGAVAPSFAPPAALAPSGTATPPETDEALRSALATLQRMTARG